MRDVGTIVRGIRTPIVQEGDDLAKIVVDSVLKAAKSENFEVEDRDVIAITEAVVGISEGNFATLDQIAKDIKNKFNNADHIGLVYPILSRNRFAVLLSAMARSTKKITLMSSFPSDEVGNDILYKDDLVKYNVNLDDLITEAEYREKFGHFKHLFTGVNMYEVYKELVEKEGCEFEMIWSNQATDIL